MRAGVAEWGQQEKERQEGHDRKSSVTIHSSAFEYSTAQAVGRKVFQLLLKLVSPPAQFLHCVDRIRLSNNDRL